MQIRSCEVLRPGCMTVVVLNGQTSAHCHAADARVLSIRNSQLAETTQYWYTEQPGLGTDMMWPSLPSHSVGEAARMYWRARGLT